jgi:phage nucleotide-binding protein
MTATAVAPPVPGPPPITLAGLRIRKVKDSLRDPVLNILVYGQPGSGKTVLAGSADSVPEMRKVLYIDFESGILPLRDRNPDLEVLPISGEDDGRGWYQLQQVYDTLHKGDHDYRTVVIDSLSEVQKLSMYAIMTKLIKDKPDRNRDVPDKREWGINLEQCRRMIRGFRDLPLNTIVVCHEKTDVDQITSKRLTMPKLTGQLPLEVAGFFDEVLYLYVKEGDDKRMVRKVLTGANGAHIAKDRSDKLPLVISDPDMQKIYQLITTKTGTHS